MKDVQADESRHVFTDTPISRVLRDEVLVRVFMEPAHKGTIITSTIDRGYTNLGRIEKVGPDVRWLREGDIIVMEPWKGRPVVTAEGRKALLRESEVVARVEATP